MSTIIAYHNRCRREIPPKLARFFKGEVPFAELQLPANDPRHDDTPRPLRRWPPVRTTAAEELAYLFNVRIPAVGTAYSHALYGIMAHEHLIFNNPVHSLMEGYYRREDGDDAMRFYIGGPLDTALQVFVSNPKLLKTSVIVENNKPRTVQQMDMRPRSYGVLDLERSETLAYVEKALVHRYKKPWMGDDATQPKFDFTSVNLYGRQEENISFWVFPAESRRYHMRKIIRAFLLAEIRLLSPSRRMREMRDKALALCMAMHPRLGADSPLRLVSDDVFLKYIMLPAARKMLVAL